MAAGEWSLARDLVRQSRDPDLAALYEWMLYRGGEAAGLPFNRIALFLDRHPDWPARRQIQASAERNMPQEHPAAATISWFAAYPPVTGEGILKLLDAGRKGGQEALAKAIAQKSWAEADVTKADQDRILDENPTLFARETQRKRLDSLLFSGKYTLARALAGRMGGGYEDLVLARIALAEEKPEAASLASRVPAHLQRDPGFLYERLRWRRRNGQEDGAVDILKSPPARDQITNPEDWWKERNILVRARIERKDFNGAYALARAHEAREGPEYAEAEWLAGWLALRFLRRPQEAARHFESMYGSVKTAISKARGAYWIAMALEAKGEGAKAGKWFEKAAAYPKTYYGQIALVRLKRKAPNLLPVLASSADMNKIRGKDMVRAIRLAHAAGEEKIRDQLVGAMIETLETPGDYAAFSVLLSGMGLKTEAFRVAKKAAGENYFLGKAAYPDVAGYTQGLSVDTALVHAVIRQESQFDPQAESPAGALGLMQLMPATAQDVARKNGWDNKAEWLTSRPEYNVRLGSAYLNELIERFSGAYPLAIAAYNAGPSRVNGWLEDFGDPRSGEVDWVDWIELIPVSETRNYVQRVVEGYVVYREHRGI